MRPERFTHRAVNRYHRAMPHRDALEAALAKIAALQEALDAERVRHGTDDATRDRIASLEQRVAQAERARDAARAQVSSSQPRAAVAGARDAREVTTLEQHNLAMPPAGPSAEWPRARVLCPRCADRGERVEMVVRGGAEAHQGVGVKILSVTCLRCGTVGSKRVS